jgi:hypothetical protein
VSGQLQGGAVDVSPHMKSGTGARPWCRQGCIPGNN